MFRITDLSSERTARTDGAARKTLCKTDHVFRRGREAARLSPMLAW